MNTAASENEVRGTVLVVDDEPPILNSLRRILLPQGYRVHTAQDPVEALDVFKEHAVDVLITDYMMPGLDGLDLLMLVRENWPGTASIMMTASNDMRVAAEAVNKNLIDFFVAKPWNNQALVELVNRAIHKNRASETARAASGQRLFGKYRLEELLATGGMAEIWRASSEGADGFRKQVVIKKILEHLSRDPAFVSMFIDEARVTVQLNHGNIVSVLDFGNLEGTYYLVMEYVDGPDLRHLLYGNSERATALPLAEACLIARQAALGLDYAHRKADDQGRPLQLVHRDIAPQNILISREGVVKVADFGIARATTIRSHTSPGMVRGTIYYMSYEQLCGQPVDNRTDIYALGAVLYELLTGRPPFWGQTHQETVALISRGKYTPLRKARPEVPRRVAAVVEKALRQNPERRFTSAAEMESELALAMHKSGLQAVPADLARLVQQRLAAQVAP